MDEDAYFAGLFDGEGSVLIIHQTRQNRFYQLDVKLGNTYTEVVEALQRRYGGSIHKTILKSGKPYHTWRLRSGKAADFLIKVLPFLIIKRAQAELGLTFQEGKYTRGGYPKPTYELEEEESIREQIRTLNRG